MQAILNVALPVFGLILAGFLAARFKLLGGSSTEALNKFVYYFALPAMLFLVMFRAPLERVVDREFLIAYCTPLALVFALTVLWGKVVWRLRLADISVQSLSSCYGNVGYMGVPLVQLAYGPEALPYAIAATILTGSIMFGAGIMGVEADLRSGQGALKTFAGVLATVARNPLILAPAAGAAWALSGVPLFTPLKTFAELMGASASPCALFALGMFLAAQPLRGELAAVSWLTVLKLAAAPVATFVVLVALGEEGSLVGKTALLLNALPTGAGAFVLAQKYDRLVVQTSATILISTVLSVLTVSALLAVG